MDIAALHEGNRDAWNRTARGGYGQDIDADVELLKNGGTNLMPNEIRVLGNIKKDRTIHLQCSHGLDALSLWKLGAKEIIGVDISEEMLAVAKKKSDALNAPATWIRSDVLETPAELNGTADLVHTGRGAICWMMDLDAWAATVARLLKPGGHLFLFEGHPLDFLWETEASTYELRPGATYFTPGHEEERGFPYHAAEQVDPTNPVQLTSRIWTLGQVITATIRAGLRIELLEEHPEPFWDQFKQIPAETLARLPHTFTLLATKPK